MENLSQVLEKIKGLRVQKGKSQTQMADLLGITQAGYANIESNSKVKLSLANAVGIAKALEIGFNELYDIDGDSQKIDDLNKEIETLKKRVVELDEQLNDKRQLIQFLSDRSELLKEFAWMIYCEELETNLSSNESTNKSVFSKQLDREDFMRYHAIEYLKKCFDEGKILSFN